MECEINEQIEGNTKKTTIEVVEPPAGKKMRPSDQTEYDTLIDQLANRLKVARHPDSLVTIKAARLLIENILASSKVDLKQQSSADSGSNINTTDPQPASNRATNLAHNNSSLSPTSDNNKANNIRIQQTKFNLDDVSLPSSLITSWLLKSARTTTPAEKMEPKLNDISRAAAGSGGDESGKETIMMMMNERKDELKGLSERALKSLKLLYLNDQKQLQLQVNEIISSIQSITANPKTDSKLLSSGRSN